MQGLCSIDKVTDVETILTTVTKENHEMLVIHNKHL